MVCFYVSKTPGCIFSIYCAEIMPLFRRGGLAALWGWGDGRGGGSPSWVAGRAGPCQLELSHNPIHEQDSWGHWGQPWPWALDTFLGMGQGWDGTSALFQHVPSSSCLGENPSIRGLNKQRQYQVFQTSLLGILMNSETS